MKRFQRRPLPAERRGSKRSAGRADAQSAVGSFFDTLEARQLLSGGATSAPLSAPGNLKVTIGYREAPDGGTTRAHVTWTDTNSSETGYRVEYSSDGVTNWTVIGADVAANSTIALHTLNAGQKLYYRAMAVAGSTTSEYSNIDTPMMPIDRVVQVTASASGNTITVKWPIDPDAVSYKVYRKARTAGQWTLLTPTPLAATSTSYTDLVPQGQAYEYQVERVTRNFYGTVDGTAYGYVYAGNRFSGSDVRGRVLLVVDQTRVNAIANELTQYRRDLLADGWAVQQITVARDNGDARQAAVVKAQIQTAAASQAGPLKSIVLIGHVPVPYSGTTAWDGHPDHAGAWPADGYYGEGIGTDAAGTWTDVGLTVNIGYPDNHNAPFDGKFDQDNYPGAITVPVGRIDFSNLPGMVWSFNPPAPNADAGETQILQRYFDKNHAWRTRATIVGRTAIEDDHLGGGIGENGWRNFAPLVGASNTSAADWITTMTETSNLWSAGAGGGGIEYALGIIGIDQFHSPNKSVNSVFNLLSGSWFGDWNKHSNLMRELVGANGTSLAAMYAGTPNVFLHTMGLGETIGQAMMLSQNNSLAGPYQPPSSGARGTQMGLIGDPTLTQSIMMPVANLTSARASNINSISWTTSSDSYVTGFHVYRGDSADGPFYRLNTNAIATAGVNQNMTFVDPTPIRTLKKFTYMVRAIRVQTTPSGTFENFSWGQTVQGKTTNTDNPDTPTLPGEITVNRPAAPTPALQAISSSTSSSPSLLFSESLMDKPQVNPLDDLGL